MKEIKRTAAMNMSKVWKDFVVNYDGFSYSIKDRKIMLAESFGYKKSSMQELFATMDKVTIELLYDTHVRKYTVLYDRLCAATYLKKEGNEITFKCATKDEEAFYDVYAQEYAEIAVRIVNAPYGGVQHIEAIKEYRSVSPTTVNSFVDVYRKGNKFIILN